MAPAEQNLLLRVLHERDIALGEDDVAWAFTNSETRERAEAFVREYLSSATLLNKDELDYYEGHGLPSPDAPASYGRPLSNAECEAAISVLEASTSAIERQSRILETQKEALQEIKARNTSAARAVGDGRRKKLAREKAQLDFEIDELLQDASNRLLSASKQTEAVTSGLPSQVDRLLEKDDRLLNGLQKLLPKMTDVATDAQESASVEQLCSALAMLSIEEIQTRLDRAYQEGVAGHGQLQNGSLSKGLTEQQRKQRETLCAELEELSGEIDGLVGIVVDNQYRKPLQQNQFSALAESQSQRAQWSEYTVSALAYLTSRLHLVNEHIQRLHGHRGALQVVSAQMDDLVSTVQPTRQASVTASPSRMSDRNNSKGLKPLRLVQANLSEGQDPAIQFLRQHEIRVSDAENIMKLGSALSNALRDRTHRSSNLSRSVEHSSIDAVVQSLARANGETQDLLRAVYAHSKLRTIQLVDPGVQAGMSSLEGDTQRIGDEMRDLNTDAIVRALAAKQAAAVQKLMP